MRNKYLAVMAVVLITGLSGCGGGSSTTSDVPASTSSVPGIETPSQISVVSAN